MDGAFLELLKQSPYLAVLVWLVWTFLSHIERRDKSYSDTVRGIAGETHAVMDRNTVALDRNTEICGRMANELDRAEQRRNV